ncbi:hypothetical protein CP981_29160 [Streptomyces platensis]|uniref:Uncharacterized protein n=1 Tax=Streptomyces platensis TaxID=58346 RepID=A0AAE6TPQ7_STRPT|nr:hypothetical protein [Streptomyces platensis]QEV55172.1 hypothetical protein CP981_29160 [Streptomyces platensis]
MKIFSDDGSNLPSLELGGETSDPTDQYIQRQVRGWALLPLFFAILLPWLWVYFAFTYDLRKDLPFLALVVTHAGLALIWIGRRSSRRLLTWAGVGCYPLAVALCLLLQNVL